MNNDGALLATRVTLLGLLAVAWLLGLVIQITTRVSTGYMDVLPPQLLLGVLLCLGAGVAARIVDPVRRSAKRGALAGVAMTASIVVGYVVLTALMWNPDWSEAESGGETWFTLLLEAPFWIGIPLVISAGVGALGWLVTDRVLGPLWPAGNRP